MAIAVSEEGLDQVPLNCSKEHPSLPLQAHSPSLDEFEDLYITYRPRVRALCLRMTGNPDDAEDLTQETFIRMFQKLNTYRGESAICTWLRRITINVVLLRFQKASWRRETSMEELSGPDTISGCPHKMEFGKVDNRLREAIDRINLQRALEQLPPGFKAVLILHDIEGYEHYEISELMGCSIGTSKSQLHKARLRMRELLECGEHQTHSAHVPAPDWTPRKSRGGNQAVWQLPPSRPQGSLVTASRAA